MLSFGLIDAGLLVFVAARAANDRRETATYVELLIFLTLGAVYLLSIYRTSAGYIILCDDALTQVLPNGSKVSIKWNEITEIARDDPFPGRTRVISAIVNKTIRLEHQLRDYLNLIDEITTRVPHLHEHLHVFHIDPGAMAFAFLLGIPAIFWGLTGAGIPRGPFGRVEQFLLCVLGFSLVWIALNLVRSVTVGRYSVSIKTLLGNRMVRDITAVELRQVVVRKAAAQLVVVITTRSGGQTRILNVKEGIEVLYAKLTALVGHDEHTDDRARRAPVAQN
jgi:hypothetical protein